MSRTLTSDQAARVYDRIGAIQDSQAFYEDAALDALVDAAAFADAHAVVELGVGTGRLAARLLGGVLPADATFVGLDVSATMLRLSRSRLENFGDRASVAMSDASEGLPIPDASCDRLVSTYVLDLLSDGAITAVLDEAHRVLEPGGRLCLVSLTEPAGALSSAVIGIWRALYRMSPSIVGGCRPILLAPRLSPERWSLVRREVVVSWGVPSEVVVARRRTATGT